MCTVKAPHPTFDFGQDDMGSPFSWTPFSLIFLSHQSTSGKPKKCGPRMPVAEGVPEARVSINEYQVTATAGHSQKTTIVTPDTTDGDASKRTWRPGRLAAKPARAEQVSPSEP